MCVGIHPHSQWISLELIDTLSKENVKTKKCMPWVNETEVTDQIENVH